MRYCLLMRYSSLYQETVEKFLDESNINDYIFTDNIDFVNFDVADNKLRPQKSIGLIITLDESELSGFEKLFDNLISKNAELKNKIRYFVSPVYKEG
ncbi:MAG TPA: hypothetical protein PKY81_02095 [bacterium]|nr:hypothetical protein [bacterium]HPN29726.1 hypothetical protein [bacterium]